MREPHILYWCYKCHRHTYWRGERCQLCYMHRIAFVRNVIIAAVCILVFVASCARIWLKI